MSSPQMRYGVITSSSLAPQCVYCQNEGGERKKKVSLQSSLRNLCSTKSNSTVTPARLSCAVWKVSNWLLDTSHRISDGVIFPKIYSTAHVVAFTFVTQLVPSAEVLVGWYSGGLFNMLPFMFIVFICQHFNNKNPMVSTHPFTKQKSSSSLLLPSHEFLYKLPSLNSSCLTEHTVCVESNLTEDH